jgi:alkyl hydroperoxide reductase subunit AhpC
VGSNPTPRAILGGSYDNLFSYFSWLFYNEETMGQRLTVDYSSDLNKKIDYVTQYNSKAYYRSALKKTLVVNPENANTICDYIMAECYLRRVMFP